VGEEKGYHGLYHEMAKIPLEGKKGRGVGSLMGGGPPERRLGKRICKHRVGHSSFLGWGEEISTRDTPWRKERGGGGVWGSGENYREGEKGKIFFRLLRMVVSNKRSTRSETKGSKL